MGRGKLSIYEIEQLKANPYVIDVNENRIVYSNAFKELFMEEYKKGIKPTAIFREAGFDPRTLGSKRIERASARWRESYSSGMLGVRKYMQLGTSGKRQDARNGMEEEMHQLREEYEQKLDSMKRQLDSQRDAYEKRLEEMEHANRENLSLQQAEIEKLKAENERLKKLGT